MSRSRRLLEGLGVAAVLVGAATGIGIALELEDRPGAVAMYLIAVLGAVVARGPAAGAAATVLSIPLVDYFFLEPTGSLFFYSSAGKPGVNADSLISIAVLVGTATGASTLYARSVQAQRRLRELARERDEASRAVTDTLDVTGTGQWEWNTATGNIVWSDSLGPLHGHERGWQPESFEAFRALIHPDDWPALEERVRAVAEFGTGYEHEFRAIRPDGSVRWLWTKADLLGERLVGVTRDVTDRRSREETERRFARATAESGRRARALQSITSQLSHAATPHEVIEVAIREGLATIRAQEGAVGIVDRDGRVLRRVTSAHAASERGAWDELPVDAEAPGAVVFRTGEPLWLTSRTEVDRRFPLLAAELELTSFEALCTLPLEVANERIGFLAAIFAEPREFDDDDRTFVQAVVGQCALAFERSLLLEAERIAADRIGRLQRVTATLAGAQTVAEIARAAVGEGVGALDGAAGALVVATGDGRLETIEAVGYGEELLSLYRSFALDADVVAAQVARTRRPLWVESIEQMRETYPPGELALRLRLESEACAPLLAGDDLLGVLLVGFEGPRVLSSQEKELFLTLGRLCAQALENAQRYEREHRIAETLQRSLLPESLPARDDVRVAARYLPGSTEADVGGDWYDLVTRGDGRIGGAVGDIGGKGVLAASRMGQLRAAARAYAIDGASPAAVMTRLNDLVESTESVFATLVTFDLDPTTGAFRYCVAGHPHPILLRKGRASFLDGAQCLPLGVGPDAAYTEAALTLDAGDVILLYTDGVVERRDERLDERLELLLRTVEAGGGLHPEALADHVVRELVPEPARADDVALLALELLGAAAPIDHTAPPDPVVLGDVQQELRG